MALGGAPVRNLARRPHERPAHGVSSFASEPPFEHYGEIQSEEALRYAGEILELVRSEMA